MVATTAKWTLEDYHRMVEAGLLEGRAVEFLHGEIVEMSPEGTPHAAASSDAGEYLSGRCLVFPYRWPLGRLAHSIFTRQLERRA